MGMTPCSSWRSQAFAWGVRGYAHREIFINWSIYMVRFGKYFVKILSEKIVKLFFFYIKIIDNVLLDYI